MGTQGKKSCAQSPLLTFLNPTAVYCGPLSKHRTSDKSECFLTTTELLIHPVIITATVMMPLLCRPAHSFFRGSTRANGTLCVYSFTDSMGQSICNFISPVQYFCLSELLGLHGSWFCNPAGINFVIHLIAWVQIFI